MLFEIVGASGEAYANHVSYALGTRIRDFCKLTTCGLPDYI